MPQPCDLITDLGMDSQFFFQFPAQGVARLLAIFNFSPREFPLERHGLMPRALADEQLAILFDHGCYDPFHNLDIVSGVRGSRTLPFSTFTSTAPTFFPQLG